MERYSFHISAIVNPDLCLKLNLSNPDQLPRFASVDLHISSTHAVTDPSGILAGCILLREWTGQAPTLVYAKKSVSSFRLFQGTPLGGKLRLRGTALHAFLDQFIHRDLPCIQQEFQIEAPYPNPTHHSNESLYESFLLAHMSISNFRDPLFHAKRWFPNETKTRKAFGTLSYGIESLASFHSLAPLYSLLDVLAGADIHFRQTQTKICGLPLLLSGVRFPLLSALS
uniref:Ribosomal protein L5 n=1 Tax=Prasinococcus sp. CCMP1194 TaxID=110672 RepID=A0A650AKM1_9VIRI|nr:ribosomal protein L5 [Prasinococcus sp. CCMP1194]